jgi:DNA-binding IclR family transcriptional regulator
VRDRGYAVDDEEIEEGLRCVGAPVRDHTGRVVASMSVAGPAFRLTRAKVPGVARILIQCSDELSTDLGHRPEPAANSRLTATRRSS